LLLRIQIYIKKRRVQLFFENNPVRDLAAKGASSRIASFQALRIIGNQCPATLYPLSELQSGFQRSVKPRDFCPANNQI